MAALSFTKTIRASEPIRFTDPVKAGVKLYRGAIAVLDGGFLAPGRTALNLVPRGIVQASVDNSTGGNGAITGETLKNRAFWVGNDGSITRTHIGAQAYIVDDQTVAATDGAGTRSALGIIHDIDPSGVLVEFK
jgi:hypothetical protein